MGHLNPALKNPGLVNYFFREADPCTYSISAPCGEIKDQTYEFSTFYKVLMHMPSEPPDIFPTFHHSTFIFVQHKVALGCFTHFPSWVEDLCHIFRVRLSFSNFSFYIQQKKSTKRRLHGLFNNMLYLLLTQNNKLSEKRLNI